MPTPSGDLDCGETFRFDDCGDEIDDARKGVAFLRTAAANRRDAGSPMGAVIERYADAIEGLLRAVPGEEAGEPDAIAFICPNDANQKHTPVVRSGQTICFTCGAPLVEYWPADSRRRWYDSRPPYDASKALERVIGCARAYAKYTIQDANDAAMLHRDCDVLESLSEELDAIRDRFTTGDSKHG